MWAVTRLVTARSGTFAPACVVGLVVTSVSASTTDLLDAGSDTFGSADPGELAGLTAFDRCDSPGCTAQAYVRARLRTRMELVFCGHHGHDLAPALVRQGAVIRDDSHLLTQDRLLG
jgi:hypothetical protein